MLVLVIAPLLLVAASPRPALAQEKRRFVVDVFVAPEPELGFGYYVTDRLALHPSIAFGQSSLNGTFYSVGGVLRFYLRPQRALEPYLQAQAGHPTPTLLYADRDIFGMSVPKPPLPDPT